MGPDVLRVLFTLLGLSLVAVGLPLARRRVRPNHWYGLRTRSTLEDPEVWYEANALLGRELAVVGVGLGALAWLWPAVARPDPDSYALGCALAALVATGVVTARGARLAARLRRRGSPGA